MLVKRHESLSHMLREFYETSPSGCVRCLLLGRGPRAFTLGLYASPLAAAYLSRSCWAHSFLRLGCRPTSVGPRGVFITSRRSILLTFPLRSSFQKSAPCVSCCRKYRRRGRGRSRRTCRPRRCRCAEIVTNLYLPCAYHPIDKRQRPPHPQIRRRRRCQRKQRTWSGTTVRGS